MFKYVYNRSDFWIEYCLDSVDSLQKKLENGDG
jgi:hypothetical protein